MKTSKISAKSGAAAFAVLVGFGAVGCGQTTNEITPTPP